MNNICDTYSHIDMCVCVCQRGYRSRQNNEKIQQEKETEVD